MKNSITPNVKAFTVAELRNNVTVPHFQRWLVQTNLEQLRESIESIGLKRCPIICKVKDDGGLYIIDGNHILQIMLEKYEDSPEQTINCIYEEVQSLSDASRYFKMVNTKGKQLDHIDITNLYMHTTGGIYTEIWYEFLHNPQNSSEVPKHKYFSLPTIIEILCVDKSAYRNGAAKETPIHIPKKNLLKYLINNAESRWNEVLGEGREVIKPNGGALIGIIKSWFEYELHDKYENWEELFLIKITAFYQSMQNRLMNGEILNRDNSGRQFITYLKSKQGGYFIKEDAKPKRRGRPRKTVSLDI